MIKINNIEHNSSKRVLRLKHSDAIIDIPDMSRCRDKLYRIKYGDIILPNKFVIRNLEVSSNYNKGKCITIDLMEV